VKPHRRARDVLLCGDRHEVSQMTEFHLRQVCPMSMMSQATRYFRNTFLADNVRTMTVPIATAQKETQKDLAVMR
jgi:hypothetical protein